MATLGFTLARKQDIFSIEALESSPSQTSSTSGGQEARQFYENLLKDGRLTLKRQCEQNRRNKRKKRRSSRRRTDTDAVVVERAAGGAEGTRIRETSGGHVNSEMSSELQGLKLLRFAQDGNLTGLKDLLSKGVDINFQVGYVLISDERSNDMNVTQITNQVHPRVCFEFSKHFNRIDFLLLNKF